MLLHHYCIALLSTNAVYTAQYAVHLFSADNLHAHLCILAKLEVFVLSVNAFLGNWTHDLDVVSVMYLMSYRKTLRCAV